MSVSEIRDWHSSLRTAPGFRGACHRAGHFGPDPLVQSGLRNACAITSPRAPAERDPLHPGEGEKRSVLAARRRPSFAPRSTEARPDPRRTAAGGGTGSISIAPGSKKSGRRNADRRVNLPSASADAAARLISLPHRVRGGQGGARSPVGVPPRRLRQRTNAAAQLQHALPGTRLYQALPESGLSQSSELLADRSWCRPGVFPEPPGDGSDEPPPAGTALAPAAGVTRLPSCKLSEIRDLCSRNGDHCQ